METSSVYIPEGSQSAPQFHDFPILTSTDKPTNFIQVFFCSLPDLKLRPWILEALLTFQRILTRHERDTSWTTLIHNSPGNKHSLRKMLRARQTVKYSSWIRGAEMLADVWSYRERGDDTSIRDAKSESPYRVVMKIYVCLLSQLFFSLLNGILLY